jgi:hypothetical protein
MELLRARMRLAARASCDGIIVPPNAAEGFRDHDSKAEL